MTMTGGGLGIAHLADIEPIGRGQVGVVYAATDLKLDRRVAVRVLDPLTEDSERTRFNHESRVLGRLSAHPNVVTIYDAGFAADDKPFLIMELVDGDSLADHLRRRGPLPWTEAVDLTLQICAGLEQAHRSGALHRDLRPENIVMTGAPKLADFGIAAATGHGERDVSSASSPADEGPSDAGGLLHRAPEAFDDVWDERTDLYSLTSILFEMIDGHAPFWRPGADTADALQLRLRHESAPELDPEMVPAALGVFVSAGLSTDPLDRPQSAAEFAHELRLIRDGRTTGSTPSVLHGITSPLPVAQPPTRPADHPMLLSPEPVAAASLDPVSSSEHGPGPGTAPVAASMSASTTFGSVSDAWAPPQGSPSAPAPPTMPASSVPASLGASTLVAPGDGRTSIYESTAPPAPQPGPGSEPGLPRGSAEVGAPDDGPHHRRAATGTVALTDRSVEIRSSPVFLAAVALMAVGVIGLAAVLAMTTLGSDERGVAAPRLPDPAAPSTVVAGSADQPTPTSGAADAMVEEMTTTEPAAEEMSTTETTIPRLAVPQLVGMNVEAASRILTDAGFQVLVVGRKSAGVAPGTVTQQEPDAGDRVALPLTVTLYIPRVSTLPPMMGRSADSVCLELQALGLRCDRVLRNDDRIPAGSVIATDPVEGSLFSEGSSVKLQVSRGPVMTVAVPDVSGQTVEEAQAALMTTGFTVIATARQPTEAVERGRVIGTDPAAATALATDQPLTILVSSGPPVKVALPDLGGLSGEAAQQRLTELGLTATTAVMDLPVGDPGIGVVVATDPAAGSEVLVGSAVTMTVGRQASTTTVPPESSGGTDATPNPDPGAD